MRNHLVSFALATADAIYLPSGVNAARPCGGSNGGNFQYRLGDVRYDGPDPSKKNDLATIAASLQGSNGTPLYECVGQWPRRLGPGGTQGETDDSSHCVPKSTDSGTRPSLNIATALVPGSENASPTCVDTSKEYQSWRMENWQRSFKMEPGASPIDPKLSEDSGPSFTLKSSANGNTFNCSPSEGEDGAFAGSCTSSEGTSTTADFRFDPLLNMLEITEHWACEDA
ncbi:predicted protein [Chaetomium globosum CBS 148.51]|uniref:Ig-like domain-containing protein n=1 Tax=Chaetomium globosum (strain ATCC 6205 / CBS 148.51 / DSM 1962 / NBRC 6347 / NRRL 1970) TaxID=306901 RepID=Q2GRD5_CHAGB|nr:uncharacterized protein CHGG_09469 [Chaetomium globosum CBS 148.51]EAQ85455.1 predicted protein [Chaetomium globosum CBS 148.51]